MSWGVAHRLRGMDSVMRCLTSWSSSRPYAVSTHPGPSTFTRTWGAADCASARLKLYTPPFTAQNTWLYSPRIAPVRTWSHDMLRMTPPAGCSRISATAVHDASTVPRRSTARRRSSFSVQLSRAPSPVRMSAPALLIQTSRSEEHTSELQSRQYLVCRLLLEKKKRYTKSSSTKLNNISKQHTIKKPTA